MGEVEAHLTLFRSTILIRFYHKFFIGVLLRNNSLIYAKSNMTMMEKRLHSTTNRKAIK